MNWVSTSAVHPCASGHIMLLSVVAEVVHFCATYFEIRGKHPNCWELNWMCSRWDIISFDVLSLVVPLPTLNSRVFFVFTLLLSLKNGNKNGTNPNKKWRWRWLLNCVECSKQWFFRKRGTARRLLAHVFFGFQERQGWTPVICGRSTYTTHTQAKTQLTTVLKHLAAIHSTTLKSEF